MHPQHLYPLLALSSLILVSAVHFGQPGTTADLPELGQRRGRDDAGLQEEPDDVGAEHRRNVRAAMVGSGAAPSHRPSHSNIDSDADDDIPALRLTDWPGAQDNPDFPSRNDRRGLYEWMGMNFMIRDALREPKIKRKLGFHDEDRPIPVRLRNAYQRRVRRMLEGLLLYNRNTHRWLLDEDKYAAIQQRSLGLEGHDHSDEDQALCQAIVHVVKLTPALGVWETRRKYGLYGEQGMSQREYAGLQKREDVLFGPEMNRNRLTPPTGQPYKGLLTDRFRPYGMMRGKMYVNLPSRTIERGVLWQGKPQVPPVTFAKKHRLFQPGWL